MKKSLKLFICLVLIAAPALSIGAMDFGLILDQTAGFGGYGSEGKIDYSGMLIPRFSFLLGDDKDLYVSAGLRAEYLDSWAFVPELLRTDFTLRFGEGELKLGRMQYSDPLGFIADGLFDGARIQYDTSAGTFGAGVWYTGLLYKKRANIAMTNRDLEKNFEDLNYSDFFNTYFAPRRIVGALDWGHPAIAELFRINAAIIGQADFADEDALHSQYLAAKMTFPVSAFTFDLGGSLGLVEYQEEFKIALAGELGAAWMLPTPLEDQLSFLGRFTSGVVEEGRVTAFLPITTKPQGEILKAKLSGLSMLSLDYTARILPSLSASVGSSYFIRSDLATYSSYGAEGYFLGNEFYGSVFWSPASDVLFNLSGGAFLPSLGDAAPSAEAQWRVELNVILSLY